MDLLTEIFDVIDGGPVPLLYPLTDRELRLWYPALTVFGAGYVEVWINGPLVAMWAAVPRPGYGTYGFLTDSIAWANVFLIASVGSCCRHERRKRGLTVSANGGDQS